MTVVVRSWSTRGNELDQDGLVPPRTWLSYMEHLRWESLAGDSTLELSRMMEGGHHFVVVAQQLQVEHDLGLAVPLWAELSVGHVGRSSIEFRHLFRRENTEGQILGRGTVTAVYLDPAGRPTPLPDAVRARGGQPPDGAWAESAPGEAERASGDGAWSAPLELPAAVPDRAWIHELEVRPSDQDLLRHVNHAVYLAYVDDTRRLCAARGGYGDVAPEGRIVRARLEYLQQALAGERLQVSTWVHPLPGTGPPGTGPAGTGPSPGPTLMFVIGRGGEERPVCRVAVELK